MQDVPLSWAERAADRSPLVQRSRSRSLQQTKAIVDAARRLILAKGSRFTTQELAKEAGIALQTFYRHFPGKDQLILAVIEDMIIEQVEHYEDATRDVADPVERLRAHVMGAVASLNTSGRAEIGPRFITAEHWRLRQLYPEELAHATQPFADLIARDLRTAEAAGLLAPTDIERDAALVAELVMSVYHFHAFATSDEPAAAIGAHLWSFCLSGLGGARPAAARPPAAAEPTAADRSEEATRESC